MLCLNQTSQLHVQSKNSFTEKTRKKKFQTAHTIILKTKRERDEIGINDYTKYRTRLHTYTYIYINKSIRLRRTKNVDYYSGRSYNDEILFIE